MLNIVKCVFMVGYVFHRHMLQTVGLSANLATRSGAADILIPRQYRDFEIMYLLLVFYPQGHPLGYPGSKKPLLCYISQKCSP